MEKEALRFRLVLHLFLTDVVNRLVDADAKSQQLVKRETIRAFPIVAVFVTLLDLDRAEFTRSTF